MVTETLGKSLYDSPEYWCGNIGYRPPGYDDFTVNTLKEISVMLFRPKSILDVGCAFGYSVYRLRLLGYDAMGIDISNYAISQADPSLKPFLIPCAAWEIPLTDKRFDFVFSSGMLEHIPKEKLSLTIAEMVRVGNRGLIGVSCSDDPTYRAKDEDATHEVVLTRGEWQALFPPEFVVISDSEHNWRLFPTLHIHRMLEGK